MGRKSADPKITEIVKGPKMEITEKTFKLSNHVVICNCNEKVKTIVEELQYKTTSAPFDIILLVQDKVLWENNPKWHPQKTDEALFITLFGNPFDQTILQKACIGTAKSAIILADPAHGQLADAQSTLMAVAIEKQNPQVQTIQELILSVNREHLKAMNVDEVVCLGEISEKLIAQSCITPGVKNIFENLLTTENGTTQIFLPSLGESLAGRTFRQIAKKCIMADAPFIVMGYIISLPGFNLDGESKNSIKSVISVNPKKAGKDLLLSQYDKLIVIAYDPPADIASYLQCTPAE